MRVAVIIVQAAAGNHKLGLHLPQQCLGVGCGRPMVPGLEHGGPQAERILLRQGGFLVALGIAGIQKGKVPGFKPKAERHIICCIVTARRIGIHTGQQHGQCAGADGVLLAGIGSFHRYAAFLGGLQGALGLAGHVSFAQVGGQQGLHIKVLQNGLHAAHMVGMGVGHHQQVQLAYAIAAQVLHKVLPGILGACIDQAGRTVLQNQHGIPLPHIQEHHFGFPLRQRGCGFALAGSQANPLVNLVPAGHKTIAAVIFDHIQGNGDENSGHNGPHLGAAVGMAAIPAPPIFTHLAPAGVPATGRGSAKRHGAWRPHRGR